ncbi:lysine 2,3-aminomutase [Streptomyces zaomyceticus]|uniref:lysine 2,3-aminomutase n=1 Tax=Streptomyces zaomyceticus TaxID=68286 RepID=UPI00371B56CD
MNVFTGHRLAGLIADRTGQPALGHDAEIVGRVLPFRITSHVADELVDWSRAPDDPVYRLVMPHRDMLAPADFAAVEQTLRDGDRDRLRLVVDGLRERFDPHPGGRDDGDLRHTYPETLLVLPFQGRTCGAPCASCFRRPRSTGDPARPRPLGGPEAMAAHLAHHPEITEVLLGGDPFTVRTPLLDAYLAPLLDRPHVTTVRIRTESVSFRPQRFLDAPDADDLLRLLERVVASGRRLLLTLPISHPRELRPEATRRAVSRLIATGAVLRTEAPVVRHVNDDAGVWARMWRDQIALGLVPHALLAGYEEGPRRRSPGLSLARTLDVCTAAVRQVSGAGAGAGAGAGDGVGEGLRDRLGVGVGTGGGLGGGAGVGVGGVESGLRVSAPVLRGPVMTTGLGELAVEGIAHLDDGPAFTLRALRTCDPALTGTVAYARFDPMATRWDELTPYGPRDRALIPGESLTPDDLVG